MSEWGGGYGKNQLFIVARETAAEQVPISWETKIFPGVNE